MRRKLFQFLHLLWSLILVQGYQTHFLASLPTSPPTCPVNASCDSKWDIIFVVTTKNSATYTQFSQDMDEVSQSCSSSNTALFLSPEKLEKNPSNPCGATKYSKNFFAGQSKAYPFDGALDKADTLPDLLNNAVCVSSPSYEILVQSVCFNTSHPNQGVVFLMTDLACQNSTIDQLSNFLKNAVFNEYQVRFYGIGDGGCLPQCPKPPTTPAWCAIGFDKDYTNMRICSSHLITTVDLAILIAVGIALLIMLIVLFFYIRMRNKRKLMQRVRDRAITRERRAGTKNTLKEIDPWELEQDQLEILVEKELGRGAFAVVFEGKLLGRRPVDEIIPTAQLMGNRNDKVAIKRVPPHVDALARRDFLDEVEFMKKLGYHAHVLGMIGCLTSVDLPLIVLEYCENGDLLGFLKRHIEDKTEENGLLSPKDLLSIAWQISDGMVYLKSLDLIHRDLAARNVLLNRDLSAKISDFGLCRQPAASDSSTIYISRGGRLPVKWMAIESLRDFHFSFKTDVWSFGVVLWEMYSFGEIPYSDINATAMLEALLAGERLPQLPSMPDAMYKLMSDCWNTYPEDRKDIEELRDCLNEALSASSLYYGYLSMSEEDKEDLKL